MASEIRVNKIENRSGLGTVTFADTGVDLAGIVTATTFSGSGASLTGLPAASLTGTVADARFPATLPAVSAASLTNVPAANVVGVHTSLTVTNATTTGTAIVGGGVTISESGIEASGIGITVANINGQQVSGRRRLNINGGFQVFQRSTSASDIGGSEGYFAPDRYSQHGTGSMRYTASQSTDVPSGFGFSNSLKYDCTTASGTVSAGHFVAIEHRMEGQDLQVFCKGTAQAKQYTLSFHVKSPKTGIHWIELYDNDNDRHVCKSYTISSADTWQQVSLTFPGDTTGAFGNDNGSSLRIFFWLMAGTTYTGGGTPPSTWAAFTANKRATGQVNVFDDTSNNFYITGIQLEVGSQATAFEHLSVGEELALCQRYFYRHGDLSGTRNYALMGVGIIGHNGSTDAGKIQISAPVRMRTQPTATAIPSGAEFIVGTGGGDEGTSDMYSNSAPALWTAASSDINFWVDFNRSSGGSPDRGIACIVHANNNGANIGFDAEL